MEIIEDLKFKPFVSQENLFSVDEINSAFAVRCHISTIGEYYVDADIDKYHITGSHAAWLLLHFNNGTFFAIDTYCEYLNIMIANASEITHLYLNGIDEERKDVIKLLTDTIPKMKKIKSIMFGTFRSTQNFTDETWDAILKLENLKSIGYARGFFPSEKITDRIFKMETLNEIFVMNGKEILGCVKDKMKSNKSIKKVIAFEMKDDENISGIYFPQLSHMELVENPRVI